MNLKGTFVLGNKSNNGKIKQKKKKTQISGIELRKNDGQ